MVSPIGANGAPPKPAKKVEDKKEEQKPKAQSPDPVPTPAPAEKPEESRQKETTSATGAMEPKTAFEVSQALKKPKPATQAAPAKDEAAKDDAAKKAAGGATGLPPGVAPDGGGTAKPNENQDPTGNSITGKPGKPGGDNKPEDKPKDPPPMTTRRALDILIKDGNDGLNKIDVARDKIDRNKQDAKGDKKLSTDDLDAAIGKDGYLTKEQAEAAKHLRDSGAWDEINGKDSKATFEEIMTYRNERTSPDDANGQRPEGSGQHKVKSDGKIDSFEQGDTGDCWWLAGVNAVNHTEQGKKDIKDSIKANDDGTYSVKFKGDKNGKTYTVTEDMVTKNKNSKGDDDVKILEEAARQYYNDNPWGNNGKNPVKDGGSGASSLELLTGKSSKIDSANGFDAIDTGRDKAKNLKRKPDDQIEIKRDGKISTEDLDGVINNDGLVSADEKEAARTLRNSKAWDEINGKDDKATVEEIQDWAKKHAGTEEAKAIETLGGKTGAEKTKMIEDYKKNPNGTMLTFSAPGKDSAETGAGKQGHVFTVLGIDGDKVSYANPWDSDKVRTMSVDDLINAETVYFASY